MTNTDELLSLYYKTLEDGTKSQRAKDGMLDAIMSLILLNNKVKK